MCAQRASFAAAAPSNHWDKFVQKGNADSAPNASAKIPGQPVVAASSTSADSGTALGCCFSSLARLNPTVRGRRKELNLTCLCPHPFISSVFMLKKVAVALGSESSLPLPEIEEATDRQAIARRDSIKGSVKKMRELLFRIRDMPLDEAIKQVLHFSCHASSHTYPLARYAPSAHLRLCMDVFPAKLLFATLSRTDAFPSQASPRSFDPPRSRKCASKRSQYVWHGCIASLCWCASVSLRLSSHVCRLHRSTRSYLFAYHPSLNSKPCVSILCSFDLPPTFTCNYSCYQNKPCVPFQAAHDPCALKDRRHSQAVFQPRVCCQRTVGGRNEQSRRPPRQFDR